MIHRVDMERKIIYLKINKKGVFKNLFLKNYKELSVVLEKKYGIQKVDVAFKIKQLYFLLGL